MAKIERSWNKRDKTKSQKRIKSEKNICPEFLNDLTQEEKKKTNLTSTKTDYLSNSLLATLSNIANYTDDIWHAVHAPCNINWTLQY